MALSKQKRSGGLLYSCLEACDRVLGILNSDMPQDNVSNNGELGILVNLRSGYSVEVNNGSGQKKVGTKKLNSIKK